MAGGETKQRINDLEYENAVLRETVARLSVKPTLRDRFAMAALTAVMGKVGGLNAKIHAVDAYEIADAMMEARDGK